MNAGRSRYTNSYADGCHTSNMQMRKLIFPSTWDMSEVPELSSTRRRGRVSYQEDDVDRQYGATWLLGKVADVTGVKDDLLKVLDGNHEMVNDVLTMAYFPFVDNLSFNQLRQWQKEVKAPSEHELNLYYNPSKRGKKICVI